MNIRADHIQAILANPFYAITIAPQLVEDHEPDMSVTEWVQANTQLMRDMGADRWLAQVVAFLQSGDTSLLADPRMNPCHAVSITPSFREDHEPFVS